MVLRKIRQSIGVFIANKKWVQVFVAFALTLVILTGLVFPASRVKAVDVTIANLAPAMTSGSNYSFTSLVTINTNERIPITNLRLDLVGPTNYSVLFNPDGTISGPNGPFVSIVKQGSSNYDAGSRSGYGYGYNSGTNTIDLAVGSPTDDTNAYRIGSGNWAWSIGDIDVAAGNFGAPYYDWGSGVRFANVNIPKKLSN